MGYVVKDAKGVVVYEAARDDDLRAWDELHRGGKGATLWDGVVLLATCQGRFTVPVCGGMERISPPRPRIRTYVTANPRAAVVWS
jgi:hypothetical protein